MKHELSFEGGRVEFNLLPTSVVLDIAEHADGATDTGSMPPSALKAVMQLLDGYVVDISTPEAGNYDSISACPLPWGMEALEAILDFCFPARPSTSDSTSSVNGRNPTSRRKASTRSMSSS